MACAASREAAAAPWRGAAAPAPARTHARWHTSAHHHRPLSRALPCRAPRRNSWRAQLDRLRRRGPPEGGRRQHRASRRHAIWCDVLESLKKSLQKKPRAHTRLSTWRLPAPRLDTQRPLPLRPQLDLVAGGGLLARGSAAPAGGGGTYAPRRRAGAALARLPPPLPR